MFGHEMDVWSVSCSELFYLRGKKPQYALERRWGASTDSLYAAVVNGPIRMLLQLSVPVQNELSKISKYLIIIIIIIIIIIEARDRELRIKYHTTQILQTKTANADYVNDSTRQ